MQVAEIPSNELQRLLALKSYHILDTLPEAGFDEVTQLASTICSTPIALISLIDESRQWFKARVGLDATETPREMAFCAYAILTPDQPLVVEDTLNDIRFSDNPLVAGDPKIRFYAGWPLNTSNGEALGTLCVIDRKPVSLSAQQLEALRVLSRQVMMQMELRKSLSQADEYIDKVKHAESQRAEIVQQLIQRDELFSRIIDSSSDGVIHWTNVEADAQHWSPKFLGMLGYEAYEIKGGNARLFEHLHADDRPRFTDALHQHFENNQPFHEAFKLRTKTGEYRCFSLRGHTMRKTHGKAERCLFIIRGLREEDGNVCMKR